MARGVKKHGWSLLTPNEGSWVQDVREKPAQDDGTEQTTLEKISRYAFGRPVLFFGKQAAPPEKSGMKRRESNNCVNREKSRHILFIGRERMDWYIEDKDEK